MSKNAFNILSNWKNISITKKLFLLTLVMGMILWYAMDYLQSRQLQKIFLYEIKKELELTSEDDRKLFDQKIQTHHNATKLIMSQNQFRHYIDNLSSTEKLSDIKKSNAGQPPRWLPKRSILRSYFTARYAILLDEKGKAIEIYHHDTLPDKSERLLIEALLKSNLLLQKLSHNQAYLTSLDNLPFVFSTENKKINGKKWFLMLASPIDEKFLKEVSRAQTHGSILALVDPNSDKIVVTSSELQIPVGETLSSLTDKYMQTGKSFFDYGASDLKLQFISLVSLKDAEYLTNLILEKGQQQRLLLALILILMFLFVSYWYSRGIHNLSRRIADTAKGITGTVQKTVIHGDELIAVDKQFQSLVDELRKNTALKNAVLDTISDALIIADIHGKIQSINPATEAMFGYKKEEMLNQNVTMLMSEFYARNHDKLIKNSIKKKPDKLFGEVRLLEAVKKNGELFPIDLILNKMKIDDNILFVTSIRDVTEREQHTLLTRLSATAFETHDGMIITDINSKILRVNKAFEKITGFLQTEVIGKTPKILNSGFQDSNFYKKLWHALNETGRWEGEIWDRKKNGEIFPERLAITAVMDNKRKVTNYVAHFHELTEQKATEQALIEAKEAAEFASQAKSDFLSSMSHELRTPLNAIMGFAQLFDYGKNLSQVQKINAKEIYHAGTHLLSLVNDILDLSKIESGHIDLLIEEIAIRDVINECYILIEPFANDNSIRIIIEDNGQDCLVKADHTRLKQVLLNILSNAIKYNRKNGEVRLYSCNGHNNRVRICVSDTGLGIKPELHESLFEPFQRLDAANSDIEGTGIGLTITRQLLELMEGKIGIDSHDGEGSTFWFELPRIL
jgi:PAS domain S-box-containing protein